MIFAVYGKMIADCNDFEHAKRLLRREDYALYINVGHDYYINDTWKKSKCY